jgi:hypothetical protein
MIEIDNNYSGYRKSYPLLPLHKKLFPFSWLRMAELEVPETHVLAVASHVGIFDTGTKYLKMLIIV